MTKEVRCILFDEAEVRVAVIEYLTRRGRKINSALVAAVELDDQRAGIVGHVQFQPGTGLSTVTVDVADLLGAMLLFCGANRVPLPRKSLKALMLFRDTLILSITDSKFGQSQPAVSKNELSYIDGAAKTIVRTVLSSIPAVAMPSRAFP